MEPITFQPLIMDRVWGGRMLESFYGRKLPDQDAPIGESWELVDRPEAQSVVDHGPLSGTTLHDLWTQNRSLFGVPNPAERFPILIKILDARSDLSIQVHPPAELAPSLAGEPKTEMWFIADCEPNAKLYVGLKQGVDRDTFEAAIRDGSVANCVHAIQPQPGDSIFIPSGRLHAIGAGFLIHEIQQNSDTTYRVFDWNRTGIDGKPRELHIDQSLASINFDDVEPSMDTPQGNTLASCPYFHTDRITVPSGESITNPQPDRFSVLSIVSGKLTSIAGREFAPGQTVLLPVGASPLTASTDTTVLQITQP